MNYYNEIDPYAAQWIRNLIAAGHIPAGVVDERSIEDVTPADLAGYTQCHFFAGIAGWSLALRLAGVPDDYPIWTGSCPCQPFSAAGKGAGFTDERHLWPAFHWLIKQCKPAGVVGEQVASKDADAWLDLVCADMEAMGSSFGRLLSRLRASVRRTSETELTGWVTPTSRDWKDSGADIKPRVDGSLRLDQLPRQANLLGWPTAMAHEARLGYQRRRGDTKGSQESLTTVMVNCTAPSTDLRLQGWPTPNTMDVVDRKQIRPSRVATNRKSGYLTEDILHLKALPFPARLTVSGMLVTGLLAAMEPGGQLNPGHSRWLLGFPPEWDACAPTATQSTRGKRRNS